MAKGRISKRVLPGNQTRQIFRKKNMSLCLSGGKKYSFFGKFGVFSFLETPVLRFALLPYYQRDYMSLFEWLLDFGPILGVIFSNPWSNYHYFPFDIRRNFLYLLSFDFKSDTAWKVSKCRVFSGPYFPVFGLEKLRIWTIFTQY